MVAKSILAILIIAFSVINVPSSANVLLNRARNSRNISVAINSTANYEGIGASNSNISAHINATLHVVLATLTDASFHENLYFMDAVHQHMRKLRHNILMDSTEPSVAGMWEIEDQRRGLTSYHDDAIDALEREIQELEDELLFDFALVDPFEWTARAKGTALPAKPERDIAFTTADSVTFIRSLIAIPSCDKHFKDIAAQGANAYRLFRPKDAVANNPLKCGPAAKPHQYEIYEFDPRHGWWVPAHGKFGSANAPVPIFIKDTNPDPPLVWPYMLKKQDGGPANDYLAMKMAKWLNPIFETLYTGSAAGLESPIIDVYSIVPGFEPEYRADPGWKDATKWTEEKVKGMYFFMPYQLNFGGGWVDGVLGTDGKEYPYFNAIYKKQGAAGVRCDCSPQNERILRSLRGAIIMQVLTGARDRHKDNVAVTKDCTVMNVDYGFFLGARPRSAARAVCHHFLTMYNDILEQYLVQLTMKTRFQTLLWEDFLRLRSHLGWTIDAAAFESDATDRATTRKRKAELVRARGCGIKTTYSSKSVSTWNTNYYVPDRPADWGLFDSFAATFGAGAAGGASAAGKWKAERWMEMAHYNYKSYKKKKHRIPFIEYVSYVLFGDKTHGEERPPKIPTTKEKFIKAMETDKECANKKIWEHARGEPWGTARVRLTDGWYVEQAKRFYTGRKDINDNLKKWEKCPPI